MCVRMFKLLVFQQLKNDFTQYTERDASFAPPTKITRYVYHVLLIAQISVAREVLVVSCNGWKVCPVSS